MQNSNLIYKCTEAKVQSAKRDLTVGRLSSPSVLRLFLINMTISLYNYNVRMRGCIQ